MAMEHLMWCRVHLDTVDGQVEGTVVEVLKNPSGLSIVNVIECESQEQIGGKLTFYECDLKSCTILKYAPPKKKKALEQASHVAPLLALEKALVLNDDDDEDDDEIGKEKNETTICVVDDNTRKGIPRHIILTTIDCTFKEAIQTIGQQLTIAVSIEGKNVGRHGKISLLTISTTDFHYMFDILELKGSAFEQGLRAILESPSVLKIFHDCRQASDALYHLYNVKLVNVFDTQVADVLLFRKANKNALLPSVRSLTKCLLEYLGLTPEDVYPQPVAQNTIKADASIWMYRPLSILLIDAALKNVRYLHRLHKVMLDEMMSEFTEMVGCYLSSLRDATEQELELNKFLDDVPMFFRGHRNGFQIPVVNPNPISPEEMAPIPSGVDEIGNRQPSNSPRVSEACTSPQFSSKNLDGKSKQQDTPTLLTPQHEKEPSQGKSKTISSSDYSSWEESDDSVVAASSGQAETPWPKLPRSTNASMKFIPAGMLQECGKKKSGGKLTKNTQGPSQLTKKCQNKDDNSGSGSSLSDSSQSGFLNDRESAVSQQDDSSTVAQVSSQVTANASSPNLNAAKEEDCGSTSSNLQSSKVPVFRSELARRLYLALHPQS